MKREPVCSLLGQGSTDVVWPTMNAELAIWIGHLGKTATRCDECRRQVMMSNQASVNPSTEQTHNVMVFEREVVLPIQAVIGSPTEYFVTDSDDLIN